MRCQVGSGSYGVVCPAVHRSTETPCIVKKIDKKAAGPFYKQYLVDSGGSHAEFG